jgi:hypothetical protein
VRPTVLAIQGQHSRVFPAARKRGAKRVALFSREEMLGGTAA